MSGIGGTEEGEGITGEDEPKDGVGLEKRSRLANMLGLGARGAPGRTVHLMPILGTISEGLDFEGPTVDLMTTLGEFGLESINRLLRQESKAT